MTRRLRLAAPVGGVLLLGASAALLPSRPGPPLAPGNIWSAWSFEPLVLLYLLLAAWAYSRGVAALWRRAGVGHGIRRWQAALFAGGLLAIFAALISPLDALGEALFAAHMVQHLMLMLVAAPLLVLGKPLVALLWALPPEWRGQAGGLLRRDSAVQRGWRLLGAPLPVLGLNVAVLWAWHVPALYDAALRSEAVHAAEHASFFVAALLYWWVVFGPGTRLGRGAAVLYLFVTALQSGVLGALITLAPGVWYSSHVLSTRPWGLTPLEDQQLAGLIMWVPAGAVYLLAAAAQFVAWLHGMERGEPAGPVTGVRGAIVPATAEKGRT